jgi:hypothetical protein
VIKTGKHVDNRPPPQKRPVNIKQWSRQSTEEKRGLRNMSTIIDHTLGGSMAS